MANARSLIVQPGQLGHFHIVVRCVQQMFLCGKDKSTGLNFDHRREWIRARLFELCDIFAVSVQAFAVMNNHLHLVLTVDPDYVANWDDLEVAQRGVNLHRRAGENEDQQLARALVWRDTPEQIAKLRTRLGTLGDFMQALNYPIAKAANKEAGKKGNFWDDRYKCQSLEDEAALLAAMVYVDLNPIRANMAPDLPSSDYTSGQWRFQQVHADRRSASDPLRPICGPYSRQLLDLTQAAYLELVDHAGRKLHPGKRGAIAAGTPPVLKQLRMSERQWLIQVRGIESRYWRAVGCADSLIRLAERLGQRWVKGLVGAEQLERMG